MRSFLEDGGFEAFTTNFEDLGGLRQLPGLAVQRLMAQGYGFGAEGDWKTAAMVRIAKVMGRDLPGGASLMEDYSYDLSPGHELILGAHMLEVCPSLTTAQPSMQIHPLGIGNREDPVRLVFDADPGPAVVVGMTDMRDRFRLTANVIDVVPPPHPLPKLPVARAIWAPTTRLRYGDPGVVDGRQHASHGHEHRGRRRRVRGPGPDDADRAADHRPGHHGSQFCPRPALERCVLPDRRRPVA